MFRRRGITQKKAYDMFFYLNINQLDALNFIRSLFHASTCFEHCCAHRQEAKIVLYSIWYHHTYRWPSGAQSSLDLYTGPIGVMIPEVV